MWASKRLAPVSDGWRIASPQRYLERDHKRIKSLFAAMKLLEDSALGGGGSRGSGRVAFADVKVFWRDRDYYANPGERVGEQINKGNEDVTAILRNFGSMIHS